MRADQIVALLFVVGTVVLIVWAKRANRRRHAAQAQHETDTAGASSPASPPTSQDAVRAQ